jgi:hypothetical protein
VLGYPKQAGPERTKYKVLNLAFLHIIDPSIEYYNHFVLCHFWIRGLHKALGHPKHAGPCGVK